MMSNYPARPLIGCSAKLEEMRDEIARTAPTNATVMVRGEAGTGKDLVAQEIHLKSDRSTGAFVKVNCGALPDDLIESELFGCERGAFTGAVFRKGKFELANNGTIFLDEIGELTMRAQAKLLQVTETPAVDRRVPRRPNAIWSSTHPSWDDHCNLLVDEVKGGGQGCIPREFSSD